MTGALLQLRQSAEYNVSNSITLLYCATAAQFCRQSFGILLRPIHAITTFSVRKPSCKLAFIYNIVIENVKQSIIERLVIYTFLCFFVFCCCFFWLSLLQHSQNFSLFRQLFAVIIIIINH